MGMVAVAHWPVLLVTVNMNIEVSSVTSLTLTVRLARVITTVGALEVPPPPPRPPGAAVTCAYSQSLWANKAQEPATLSITCIDFRRSVAGKAH